MPKTSLISTQTRNNWMIDATMFTSAVIVVLTSIYFLFLPTSGYRGGRNPAYGITILFDRHTWEDFHTWSGIAMILLVALHVPLHWSWVVSMAKRTYKEFLGRCGLSATSICLSKAGRVNLWINLTIALAGLVAALSGLYFFFIPKESALSTQTLLFTRSTWDIIHTWSGVIMINAAVLHFAIHWKWATKVTSKMFAQLTARAAPRRETGTPLA